MTRKQIKYFGTKRQRAALKASGKRKRSSVAGTKKRKAAPKKKARKRGVGSAIATTKKRKSGRVRGTNPMKNVMKSLMPGAAAFGGGYASRMIEDALSKTIEDPNMRSGAVAAVGLVLVMMQPTGVMGAAGLGVIGGAGRGMASAADTTDAAGDGVTTVNGPRAKRVKQFRAAMQRRMSGGATKYRAVAGMPDDRTVITGPGQKGASYRSRF